MGGMCRSALSEKRTFSIHVLSVMTDLFGIISIILTLAQKTLAGLD